MKRILLLPGLGDVHWVFLKLQDWLRQQGPEWEMPEISIWNIDNRPRTLEYLQFIPWVRAGSYADIPLVGDTKRLFRALYMSEGTGDVVFNFHGFDVLIGTNGNMRNGIEFSRILQGAEINYDYGPKLPDTVLTSPRERPYFVLCFSGFGMFSHWIAKIPPEKVRALIAQLRERFPGHDFVFTGCAWDDEFARKCATPQDVFLVGDTTLLEFFRLLVHSDGYIGWCGGNSILSQHFGVPTVEWWSRDYFPKHDRHGWETPYPRRTRLVLEVEDFNKNTAENVGNYLEEINR
jgi:hypothetical protein